MKGILFRNITQVLDVYISGRNKGQKLVGHFLENWTFCGFLIAVLLKMYSKFGRPKWILVSQIGQKMVNGQLLFLALYIHIISIYLYEVVELVLYQFFGFPLLYQLIGHFSIFAVDLLQKITMKYAPTHHMLDISYLKHEPPLAYTITYHNVYCKECSIRLIHVNVLLGMMSVLQNWVLQEHRIIKDTDANVV